MAVDYPDDADGDALRRIAASGADISKPMDIDFFVAASKEATAKVVADKAAELGYCTEIWFDEEGLSAPWTCGCTRLMIPTYPSVIAAQGELDAIARPLGAFTDGWGTYGGGEQYMMTEPEPEPQSAAPKPARRRFQFSLRTLLLLPVIVATAGTIYLRIEHNRDQREAVHDLWRMGVLTANRPGDDFSAPEFSKDWMWHNKEGWFENLQGTHKPQFILFWNDWYSYKAEDIAAAVHHVPSIKHAFVEPGKISEEELTKLRLLLPNVEFHISKPPRPSDPPPAGSTSGRR